MSQETFLCFNKHLADDKWEVEVWLHVYLTLTVARID
jgi:hypothetical protein